MMPFMSRTHRALPRDSSREASGRWVNTQTMIMTTVAHAMPAKYIPNRFIFYAPRGRDTRCRVPPAQIPACSFSAPGSSLLLTPSHDPCFRTGPCCIAAAGCMVYRPIFTAHASIPQDATAPSPSPCARLSRAQSTMRRSDSPYFHDPFAQLL